MLNSGENLEEHLLGLEVVADVMPFLGDLGKQIAFGTVLHNDISAIRAVQNLHEGNHIRVLACKVMQVNLTVLELLLSWIKADLAQCFDCILTAINKIMRLVNSAICSDSKDSGQLNPTGKYKANIILWAAFSRRFRRRWRCWEHSRNLTTTTFSNENRTEVIGLVTLMGCQANGRSNGNTSGKWNSVDRMGFRYEAGVEKSKGVWSVMNRESRSCKGEARSSGVVRVVRVM